MILKSISKINVGLRIIGKREDGFHEIETIFYPVNFFDEIDINIKPSKRNSNSLVINSNNQHLPKDKTNICYKIIINFFRYFKITDYYNIKIFINKRIPIGGGLGGGSSNAASILKYLIKYFRIDIKKHKKDILEVAGQTGSDVPFFLISKPCYAEGKGDKLRILNNFRLRYKILIVTPTVHISSRWAYENLNLVPGDFRNKILDKVNVFDINKKELFVNEFEDIVFGRYNELSEIKNKMIEYGSVFASLSGSGSAIYGLFNEHSKNSLKKCLNYFKRKNYFYKII
ncbi:MAG: 4-(cytidine 5'-diphospho)-2-C-methyl-D-erythritol kinase [Ignavibacteria bacterium]|nr:4-(cytidine 5'-diphospho)-2-C-methyl-D-erythritol kinase [Ignavibacteria bacterium]